MAKSWYVFIGSDPTSVLNYVKVPNIEKFNCLCGDLICSIYAKSAEGQNPANPLSDNLLKYIKNGLITGQMQPEKPLDSRKYVYLKVW